MHSKGGPVVAYTLETIDANILRDSRLKDGIKIGDFKVPQ